MVVGCQGQLVSLSQGCCFSLVIMFCGQYEEQDFILVEP